MITNQIDRKAPPPGDPLRTNLFDELEIIRNGLLSLNEGLGELEVAFEGRTANPVDERQNPTGRTLDSIIVEIGELVFSAQRKVNTLRRRVGC